MSDATILYYSSNREDSSFEKKIQETILENSGGLPIVSVTQKPIKFGHNICVGDRGASGFNMIRQILLGCEATDSRYIISSESDCLYPPDYFQFRPERDDVCYRNTNTYIIGNRRDYYWKKNEGGTWSQVINRELYIKRLKHLLEGEPMWDADRKNFPKEKGMSFFESFESFTTENPCISFKAPGGMRHYSHSERIPIYNLPYWGNSKSLRKKYLCN